MTPSALSNETQRAIAIIHWVFSADGTKGERSMADEAINKISDPTFMPLSPSTERGETIEGADGDALRASPPKPSEAMVDLLAELAKHPSWELSQSYDGANEDFSDYGWCVHEVSGGANDRVWELVGFGETPAQALTAALSGGAK